MRVAPSAETVRHAAGFARRDRELSLPRASARGRGCARTGVGPKPKTDLALGPPALETGACRHHGLGRRRGAGRRAMSARGLKPGAVKSRDQPARSPPGGLDVRVAPSAETARRAAGFARRNRELCQATGGIDPLASVKLTPLLGDVRARRSAHGCVLLVLESGLGREVCRSSRARARGPGWGMDLRTSWRATRRAMRPLREDLSLGASPEESWTRVARVDVHGVSAAAISIHSPAPGPTP